MRSASSSLTSIPALVAFLGGPAFALEDEGGRVAVQGVADAEVSEVDAPTFTVGAESAAASRYVFRGFALTEAPVATPSVWAGFADFGLSAQTVVATSSADGGPLREVDLDSTYAASFGPLTVEPDLAVYLAPAGGSSAEAILTATLAGDFGDLHTSHAVDLWGAPGAYYTELGASVVGQIGDLTLQGSVDGGFGTARFHAYNAGVAVAGVTVVRSSVEATWALTAATYLSARVELDSLVAGRLRRTVDEPVLLHGGVAAGFEL